jgi:hypothetical protein
MFARLYRSYVENYRRLRAAVNAVGAECEAWSYETLDRDAERQVTLERTIDGQPSRSSWSAGRRSPTATWW